MTQPLALLCYERLMPGSQLINRLQDLGYRVVTVTEPRVLARDTPQHGAMLILADFLSGSVLCDEVRALKSNPATAHIPVIAFGPTEAAELQEGVRAAGADLVVSEIAILTHLENFLEQALTAF